MFYRLSFFIYLVVAFFGQSLLYASSPVRLPEHTVRLLMDHLSGERARHHVMMITRYHRVQASPGYRQAAQYVLSQLRSWGFSDHDAWMESFPSDGRIVYQTWQSPSGWWMDEAELRVVEPEPMILVRYPDVAMSLITYSNPGDATAELVWVGEGTRDEDYAGKDVRGKFVLATGYGGAVHRLAVLKYGARAVVCYLDDERSMRHPDMVQYTGMWPKTDELERTTFGFNISRRQGEMLRRWLEEGKRVVLHGWAKGKGLHPYEMDVVVALIRGTHPNGHEFVFTAHLDHPRESANDNASGSAALLEIATMLKKAIDRGMIPRPRLTFRFIWVPEWYGTMAYLDAHPEFKGPELGGRIMAGLNLDMVGEDLEKLHSKLMLVRTPDSLPSILNDVVADIAEQVDGLHFISPRGGVSSMNYRVVPYTGGSDHMMLIDRKIPAMMFFHDPDYTHHTSDDTPDKVDPVELKRSMFIALGAALYLDGLSSEEARYLVDHTLAHAIERITGAFVELDRMKYSKMFKSPDEFENHVRAVMDHLKWRESQHLRSVLHFQNSEGIKSEVENAVHELNQFLNTRSRIWSERWGIKIDVRKKTEMDRRVPIRRTRGPLAFDIPERFLSEEDASWYQREGQSLNQTLRFEVINFIDGKRTISDIVQHISAEFDPVPEASIQRYIDDLVKVGVLGWKGKN